MHSLPLLLPSYTPNLDRLPLFLIRLATEVTIYSIDHKEDSLSLYPRGYTFVGVFSTVIIIINNNKDVHKPAHDTCPIV